MKREFTADHYLVAYIDVLGQSNEILEGDNYPPTKAQLKKTHENLKQSSEYIKGLRSIVQKYFSKYRKNKDVFAGLNDKQKHNVQRMNTFIAEQRGVSDSIIISVPLNNNSDNCIPMNNVLAILQALCLVYNHAIASKKPVRGGIDIGLGTRMGSAEIYGSALVKAYQLESKKAKYPRILIGESFWKYINYVENHHTDSKLGRKASVLARESLKYIKKDDHAYYLDVIGDAVRKAKIGVDSKLVKEGYQYILDYYQFVSNAKNNKLKERYTKLKSYYKPRLNHWQISK